MTSRYTLINVEQGTPEWRQARCGRLCASDAADMMAKIKNGEASARRDLRTRLVLEKLTGTPADDGYVSFDMQRGKELEAEARFAYESEAGEMVQQVGFFAHTELAVGCSPDGVIADGRGLLELKVPRSATHLRYLRSNGGLPVEHAAQVTHALFVSGAEFLDFASWDPRFPPDLQLYRVRVHRSDVDLKSYELVVRLFLDEVQREYEDVLALRAERVA